MGQMPHKSMVLKNALRIKVPKEKIIDLRKENNEGLITCFKNVLLTSSNKLYVPKTLCS